MPQLEFMAKAIADEVVAIVGEAPGEEEEKHGRPFVGRSGGELDHALKLASLPRRKVFVTNCLLCRPANNKLDVLLTKVNKQNQQAVKEAKARGEVPPPPIPSPIECCRPRLEAELSIFRKFITLGKTATHAVTGMTASIKAIRGGLQTLEGTERTPPRAVMPTVHPAFVLRQMRWAHVFRNDILKAARWFRGEIAWKPPETTLHPSPEVLRQFLSEDRIYTFDLETDGIESLTCKIRCVGVGYAGKVMVCGFLGKDGETRFYSPTDEEEVKQVLIEFFRDPKKVKASWNGILYDRLVLQSQWGVIPVNHLDGILLHKSAESELPHSLAYAVSLYTTAPSWKTSRENEKISTHAESDEELAIYCGLDVSLTDTIIPSIAQQVQLRDQVGVWKVDQRIQDVCVDMRIVGMYVDQERRLNEEKKLLRRRHDLLNEIRNRLGKPAFNPGSVHQLRDVLFEQWKLTPPVDAEDALTGSGDPSTADLVLRALLTDSSIDKAHRDFIKLVRYYRKVQKLLGTYVVKLRPRGYYIENDLGWDDDDDWIDKETRKKYGLEKQGIVDPMTGRMHPGWSALTPVTGRLSCSKPFNAMNVPLALRTMIVAQPGHVLVGADADQIEVRIAAALWGIERYLTAFKEGKDPHSMTAFMIFGEHFCKVAGIDPTCFSRPGKLVGEAYNEKGKFTPKGGEAYDLRHLSKVVHLASQYMAGPEQVTDIVRSTEVPAKNEHGKERDDGTTDLPYALLPLRQVREMREKWLKGAPEYQAGWEREITEWKRQGYLREPVNGRRRDFLDGENPNELVNHKVQGSAAGLINKSLAQLHDQIPAHKWGPGTGIIGQVHDWIGVECPESEGPRVKAMLEEVMNQTHPALPGVKITSTADIGLNWKEV